MDLETITRLIVSLWVMVGFIAFMAAYLLALDSGKEWPRKLWWPFLLLMCVTVVIMWPAFIIWGLIQLRGKHGSGEG